MNIDKIKELERDYGLRLSALEGQNFLIDNTVLQTIIAVADIKPRENILEIGPGLGILTRELLSAGAQVTAVEKDNQLFAYLKEHFKGEDGLTLVNEDILKFKAAPEPYRIVANIPYSITAKIIKKFVAEEANKPKSLLIMVQKEVGKRVCAGPGRLNLLAICCQLYGRPSLIATVPAKAFYPEPKVDSCLLLIDNIKAKTPHRIGDLAQFWRILHIGFASPRKQLHNNLAAGLKMDDQEVKSVLSNLKINDKARAQELAIEQWVELAKAVDKNN